MTNRLPDKFYKDKFGLYLSKGMQYFAKHNNCIDEVVFGLQYLGDDKFITYRHDEDDRYTKFLLYTIRGDEVRFTETMKYWDDEEWN